MTDEQLIQLTPFLLSKVTKHLSGYHVLLYCVTVKLLFNQYTVVLCISIALHFYMLNY